MSLRDDALEAAFILGARHWRLWEWLNGRLALALSKRKPTRPASLRSLWLGVLNNKLLDGDFVELASHHTDHVTWYITEWVPKAPGKLWIDDRLFDVPPSELASAFSFEDWRTGHPRVRYTHLGQTRRFRVPAMEGRTLYEQGFTRHMGIARHALSDQTDKYALLGVVSNLEYFIDLGFPVVVTREVYRKLVEAGLGSSAVEIDALMQVAEIRWSKEFTSYIKAVGAPDLPDIADLLNLQLGLRSLIGLISSPLDISARIHDTHPAGMIRIEGIEPRARSPHYLLSSSMHIEDPTQLPPSISSVAWAWTYGDEDFLLDPIITDFDARVPRFASSAPLSRNPVSDSEVIQDLELAIRKYRANPPRRGKNPDI